MREIKKLEINRISLVTNPSSRIKWIVKKSDETFEGLVNQFLKIESEFGDTRIFKGEKGLVEAVKELLRFSSDIPGSLKNACDALLKKLLEGPEDYGYPGVKKSADPDDPFPSIPIPVHRVGLKHLFLDIEDEEDEEEKEDNEEFASKFKDKQTIKKMLDYGMTKDAIMELVPTKGVKKSIDSQEEFEEDPETDWESNPWPSVPTPEDLT